MASVKVHLIEPQSLFVSTLDAIFDDLGLELEHVSKDADFRELASEQPALVFIDADFISDEPLRLVGMLHTILPHSLLAVYTGQRSWEWARACVAAGANAVFSKAADRHELVEGLREMLESGAFIDVRLRNN